MAVKAIAGKENLRFAAKLLKRRHETAAVHFVIIFLKNNIIELFVCY